MKYVELLGMGASGKSTALRFLRRAQRAKGLINVRLEDDAGSVVRRAVGEFPRGGGIKRAILDRWASGALDQHPSLFAQVLTVLGDVPAGGRERSIILNYWRARMRLFSQVGRDPRTGLTIVDEGLSQTVLTTWWAQEEVARRNPEMQSERLSNLVGSLPIERYVIVVDTPIDELMRRRKRNESIGRQSLLETLEVMNEVASSSAQNGCDLKTIDGLGTPSEVAERIMKALPTP